MSFQMQKVLLLILLVFSLTLAFDKNLMRKGKRDPTEKHPISRRVLRFERSAAEDFNEFDLPVPVMDFAKVMPDLPTKMKNEIFPLEYNDLDF